MNNKQKNILDSVINYGPNAVSGDKLNKYHTLFENHPLILITISLDKNILAINNNGAKELGYESKELIGLNISILFHPEEEARLDTQIQKIMLKPGDQSSHEMKMLRKNKQVFWVRETIYTASDQNSIQEIYFVCDNITYQKNAEAEAKNLALSLQTCLTPLLLECLFIVWTKMTS